jgi:alpha-glucosidase
MARNEDWWRGAVIYQVYPRSFFDSNGDGIGDLPGVTAKLDYIAQLGVDAIWLSPFFRSPQRDFGYDVSDYIDVDPIFGTLADFDLLLARAHALGLKVLIDQVWSHTSNEHGWFKESRTGRENTRADWYVWSDPRPDGAPPNNWLSVFGGPAWTWEPRRRQYYLHHFLSHQPALNLANPVVVDALIETGAFWLERGVDGFRLDAVDFMTHDPLLRDNPPQVQRGGAVPLKLFGMQRHVHDMVRPETGAVLGRIRQLTDRYPGTTTLGEVSSQEGALTRVLGYTGAETQLHTAYTLGVMKGGFGHAAFRNALGDVLRQGETGWISWSFSNHDVERVASRWNPTPGSPPPAGFTRLLMALLLSLRGSVTIYQGEELGLPEAELAPEDMRDPFGIAYWPEFRGRDGSRTPMPWQHDAPQAGFTIGQPWLPVSPEHPALAVDVQETDGGALLHAWRGFLAWRKAHPALVSGALRPLDLPAPVLGFVREGEDERIACLFNLSGADAVVDLGMLAGASVMTATGGAGTSTFSHHGMTVLPAYGTLFLDAAAIKLEKAA